MSRWAWTYPYKSKWACPDMHGHAHLIWLTKFVNFYGCFSTCKRTNFISQLIIKIKVTHHLSHYQIQKGNSQFTKFKIHKLWLKISRNYNLAWNFPSSLEGEWDNSSSWVLHAWSSFSFTWVYKINHLLKLHLHDIKKVTLLGNLSLES